MIPAQGPNGGAYGYDDVAVVPGVRYSYWLVEVENGAEAAEYGPVAAPVRSDQVVTHAVFLPMAPR